MNSLDVKIMAVESRRETAEQVLFDVLSNKTSLIVYDDRGPNGGGTAWYNARRCWQMPTDRTHRIVLQDDIIMCDDFLKIVQMCIDFRPDAVWSFCCGRKADVKIQNSNHFYVHVNGCKTSAQALVIPVKYIAHFIEETDFVFGSEYAHDDSRLGWYCCYHNIPLYTTVPSLVAHNDVKSVIPHHNAKRLSMLWQGKHIEKSMLFDTEVYESGFVFPYFWMNENDENYNVAKRYCDRAMSTAKGERNGNRNQEHK